MSESLVEFLYRALDARLGIVVRTSDPGRTRARLYEARASAKNPAFECLSITPSRSNPGSEIWVVKKAIQPKDTE